MAHHIHTPAPNALLGLPSWWFIHGVNPQLPTPPSSPPPTATSPQPTGRYSATFPGELEVVAQKLYAICDLMVVGQPHPSDQWFLLCATQHPVLSLATGDEFCYVPAIYKPALQLLCTVLAAYKVPPVIELDSAENQAWFKAELDTAVEVMAWTVEWLDQASLKVPNWMTHPFGYYHSSVASLVALPELMQWFEQQKASNHHYHETIRHMIEEHQQQDDIQQPLLVAKKFHNFYSMLMLKNWRASLKAAKKA